MADQGRSIARKLLEIAAVKLQPHEPFTWASGIKSPIYCDNRLVLSYPSVRDYVAKALYQKSADLVDFDVVAGVATAGIPHGMLLADRLKKPFIYVREKAKQHGKQNQIEGSIVAGQSVLVVEDLISTGGSSLKAVEALREVGAQVIGIMAIFTYQFESAKLALEKANCPLVTLTDYSTLITEAAMSGYVSQKDLDTLEAWRENPEKWGK